MTPSASNTSTMLATLEEAYGGREAIVEQLSGLSDPRAQRVVALLVDPQWSGKSLADLCRTTGIAHSTMLMLLREGSVTRAVASAHVQFQRRLPEVVDKISEAAVGGLVPCPCTIGGQVAVNKDCSKCRGTGMMYTNPSLPHQELVLDVLGVTPKSGPMVQTNVNVQQNVAVGGIFDTFVKGQGRRAPSPPVLDATPVAVKE